MYSKYLKLFVTIIVLFSFYGCDGKDNDNIETCKSNGFKGVVVKGVDSSIACSDGVIKSDQYVTTKGLIKIETSIVNTRGNLTTYRNYYLEFKDN